MSPPWPPKLGAKFTQNRDNSVPEGILVEKRFDFERSCKGSRFGLAFGASEGGQIDDFRKAGPHKTGYSIAFWKVFLFFMKVGIS